MVINAFFGVKVDNTINNNIDYKDIKLPLSKKDYKKFEQKNNICINVFCYENDFPVHISKQKFEDCMDSLLINDENISHYVYIKDFNRFIR